MHGDSEVVTWTADGARRTTYARARPAGGPARARAARDSGSPATSGSARSCGTTPSTSTAYLAVPSHGRGAARPEHPAVPRAARLRRSTTPRTRSSSSTTRWPRRSAGCCRTCHDGPARHRQRPVPDDDRAALERRARRGRARLRRRCSRASRRASTGPSWTSEDDAARCATPPAPRATPRASSTRHRSNYLHAMQVCMRRWAITQADRLLAVVPLFHANAWGMPVRRHHDRRVAGHAGPVPAGRAAGPMIEAERVTGGAARADDLERPAALPRRPRRPTSSSLRVAHGGRVGLPAGADAGLRRSGTASTSSTRWGMTETSPLGSLGASPPARRRAGEESGATAASQGRLAPRRRGAAGRPGRRVVAWDGDERRRARGPRPVDHRRLLLNGSEPRPSSTPAQVRRRLAAHRATSAG